LELLQKRWVFYYGKAATSGFRVNRHAELVSDFIPNLLRESNMSSTYNLNLDPRINFGAGSETSSGWRQISSMAVYGYSTL